MHQITHHQKILSAENGFLLGNGDLSVSVYQRENALVWRFGKGNVWDRRLDLRDDPKPAHIDEVRRGILEEGWRVGTNGEDFTAIHGFQNEARSREICQGSPKSYETRPYPCPKPVGELALHLPPDLMAMTIQQTLCIEEGIVEITCQQEEVFLLSLRCWIDPQENILLVDWKINAELEASYGRDPLIWFSLYRWPDPKVEDFAAAQYSEFRVGLVTGANDPQKASPLPPPKVEKQGDIFCIRQDFYPEATFPEGSCCLLAPLCGGNVEIPAWTPAGTASLHILPTGTSGLMAVGVTASGDPLPPEKGIYHLAQLALQPDFLKNSWEQLQETMKKYWQSSSFHCQEPLLENLWYETLYAFRCVYRGGTVPPGLMFPSTLRDYSHWHGDYHSNYNFQQPFWGICAANHPEGLDSYFDGMKFFFQIGKKIARDYYGARGVFVQLSAFPIVAEDDPIGVVPLGRMAYMTGWACTLYWERYLYTMDQKWLAEVGYPAIRECALFYTDFVQKWEDGFYHAFPSNQGEEGFSGNPDDFCDREEVADYLCYCLRCAIAAAKILSVDKELILKWQSILSEYPADKSSHLPEGSYEQRIAQENPPEFGHSYLMDPVVEPNLPWPNKNHDVYRWYFGHFPTIQMKRLHLGLYRTHLDYPRFLEEIRRWRHPNGLCWALSVRNYGQTGAWTETLGILGVLMDSILQSWDGCLHLFPGIPAETDISFENFRARGAFLVSACRTNRKVQSFSIFSEMGGTCTFQSPWESVAVFDDKGQNIPLQHTSEGNCYFETIANTQYFVKPI